MSGTVETVVSAASGFSSTFCVGGWCPSLSVGTAAQGCAASASASSMGGRFAAGSGLDGGVLLDNSC
jgi:hypothetical protein